MIISRATIITVGCMLALLLIGAITILILQNQQTKRGLAVSPAAEALATGGAAAPYTDFAGNPANLDQYIGQVLVAHSWASWSPFSASELVRLAKVSQSYADAGVVVVAINRAEAKDTAESFLRSINVSDQVQLIMDNDDRFYKSIGGYTMPETVFYDQTGGIVAHKRGVLTDDEVATYIEEALAQE